MQDRWDPSLAFDDPDECVYGSVDRKRPLPGPPRRGQHVGEGARTDVTGEEIDALYVKGSGWDRGSIEAAGFAPLPSEAVTAARAR